MDEVVSMPTILIDEGATKAQRQSILEFDKLARETEAGLIEAALELQAQAPNLMPLVERITREELKRVYSTWQQIRETGAFMAILGFDAETEDLINHDDVHAKLLEEKNAAVGQRRQSSMLLRPGKVSALDTGLKRQDETLRDALMRRKFILFAGRVALNMDPASAITHQETMKSPA